MRVILLMCNTKQNKKNLYDIMKRVATIWVALAVESNRPTNRGNRLLTARWVAFTRERIESESNLHWTTSTRMGLLHNYRFFTESN